MITFDYADRLTEKQLEQIRSLVDACIAYEGLTLSCPQLSGEDVQVYLYYETRKKDALKSVLIAYPCGEYAEITAFTHPSCRCLGMFTALFERFLSQNDDLAICFYPDGCSYDALAALTALECEYTGTERLMECTLTPGAFSGSFSCSLEVCDDLSVLVPIHSSAFGLSSDESADFLKASLEEGAVSWLIKKEDRPVGMCLGTAEDDTVYLFAFCILPDLQNQKMGTEALLLLLDCLSEAYRTVKIQVTEENEPAYRLYCHAGFHGEEELMEYWY